MNGTKVVALFQKVVELGPERCGTFCLEYPVLFSREAQRELRRHIESLPPARQQSAKLSFVHLVGATTEFERDIFAYPLGPGPIERIWKRELRSEISESTALESVKNAQTTALLSPLYIRALSVQTEKQALENWQDALRLQRLTLASVDAFPDGVDKESMLGPALAAWVEVVARALEECPDRRLFESAVSSGERFLKYAERRNEKRLIGFAMHRVGILYLDPYTANRTSLGYTDQIRVWQDSVKDKLGNELNGVPEAKWRMPGAEIALKSADEYFRKAIQKRDGSERGLSIKALVQTLEFRMLLGHRTNSSEIARLCKEGLSLLSPATFPREHAALLASLNRDSQGFVASTVAARLSIDEFCAKPLQQYVSELGPTETIDFAFQLLRGGQPSDKQLKLLRHIRTLLTDRGTEQMRINAWRIELELFRKTQAPEAELVTEPRLLRTLLRHAGLLSTTRRLRGRTIAQRFKRLHERGLREHWSQSKVAAICISLAWLSTATDEEALGLKLLQRAYEMSDELRAKFRDCLNFLEAVLMNSIAVNCFRARRDAEAIQNYFFALNAFLALHLQASSLDCLRDIADIAERHPDNRDVIEILVAGLAQWRLQIERELGKPATEVVQQLCSLAMASMFRSEQKNAELLSMLFSASKGMQFRAALLQLKHSVWTTNSDDRALLKQIRKTATEADKSAAESSYLYCTGLKMLPVYLDESEQQTQGGATPTQVLDNLQRAYDAHLNKRLMALQESVSVDYVPLLALQDLIDERTVLLNYFLGSVASRNIYILAITKDDLLASLVSAPTLSFLQTEMTEAGRTITTSALGSLVSTILEEIQGAPSNGPVSANAATILANHADLYLGGISTFLQKQRHKHRDHLCIVPHAALHYFPFHLLGPSGRPLSEDWKISYLPNLALLGHVKTRNARNGGRSGTRPTEKSVAAIGLSFNGRRPFGLEEIPEATEEADYIARLFRQKPLLDSQATKSATISAIQTASMVHLSTHGAMGNFSAPCFHHLFLTPTRNDDGVLYAHELLALDLSKVELLTLSACETALGRFDAADNLRGLPASFLLAGVSTIVGTLWEAEVNASKVFFCRLYEEVSRGTTRLDAFYAAQCAAREQFPSYRDWGPFYMIGQWS